MSDSLEDPNNYLFKALEHVRQRFIYHAGQRMTAIHYFFVAFSILAVAYTSILTMENDAMLAKENQYVFLLAISVLGAIISLHFFGLDVRNQRIVMAELEEMEKIESKISETYPIPDFGVTHSVRTCGKYYSCSNIFTHEVIIRSFYSIIFTISIALSYVNFSIINELQEEVSLFILFFILAWVGVFFAWSHLFSGKFRGPSDLENSAAKLKYREG